MMKVSFIRGERTKIRYKLISYHKKSNGKIKTKGKFFKHFENEQQDSRYFVNQDEASSKQKIEKLKS